MPPARTTVDEMVEALKEADNPVLGAKSLGERVGLSARTIRERSSELEDDERVGSMQIDRATVWYYDDPNSDTPAPDTADVVDEHSTSNSVATNTSEKERAFWGMMVSLSVFISGAAISAGYGKWLLVPAGIIMLYIILLTNHWLNSVVESCGLDLMYFEEY